MNTEYNLKIKIQNSRTWLRRILYNIPCQYATSTYASTLSSRSDCKTRNDTETKRNETSRNETKRNETQQKRNKIKQKETKRNETQQKRNETKKIINKFKKNETNINETIFFYMTTIHKMPVADWKTFKIYGKIIRISYQKAHHFPASCVLCKFLRFIEKKKYIWLKPNLLSRKQRSTKSTNDLQYGGNPHHEAISE